MIYSLRACFTDMVLVLKLGCTRLEPRVCPYIRIYHTMTNQEDGTNPKLLKGALAVWLITCNHVLHAHVWSVSSLSFHWSVYLLSLLVHLSIFQVLYFLFVLFYPTLPFLLLVSSYISFPSSTLMQELPLFLPEINSRSSVWKSPQQIIHRDKWLRKYLFQLNQFFGSEGLWLRSLFLL